MLMRTSIHFESKLFPRLSQCLPTPSPIYIHKPLESHDWSSSVVSSAILRSPEPALH